MKTLTYTILALIAFAGNSVLCRLALGDDAVDASSFTSIRLLSGAIALAIILWLSQAKITDPEVKAQKGSWKAASMLFLYAVAFSFAYVSLETGTGALILFASVQITMILAGVLTGNKVRPIEWFGVVLSFAGFIYLVMPGVSAPSLTGFLLMSLAGIAWGFYTLLGRGSKNPLGDTAFNFARSLPFTLVLFLVTIQMIELSPEGIWLAIASGVVTSGIGYTIWYMALRGLSAIQAAVVQLFVPVIATFGGVIFANELLSTRLILASALILGGILIVIIGKQYWGRVVSKEV